MNERLFRDVAGTFATGVTVVTTLGRNRKPVGMTVNSFTSLSLNPPLVLFCVAKGGSLYQDFLHTDSFVVNILSADQEHLSRQFAQRDRERFEGVKFRQGVTGNPVLDDVLGYFECKVTQRYEGGDHIIVLGEVLDMAKRDGKPLIFYRGQYHNLES